ncbi:MAG: hypothetical protein IKQ70_11695 [Bacteroidales bacterium]|nr:hypothetical protein [Bacteroidales bacterium]
MKRKINNISEPVSELETVMDAVKKYLRSKGSGYKNEMEGDKYCCSLTNCRFFFEGNLPDNTKPADLKDLEVFFNITFQYNDQGKNPKEKFGDDHRKFRFELLFKNLTDSDIHISSWHLDYEPEETDRIIHPLFHLTFGGNKMKMIKENKAAEYGDLLLMSAPRWNYYPMDAVLGIDLIFSNFLNKDEYVKLYTGKYKQAVENSKIRLWQPYSDTFMNL